MNLEPIGPETALEMYLTDRETRSHKQPCTLIVHDLATSFAGVLKTRLKTSISSLAACCTSTVCGDVMKATSV